MLRSTISEYDLNWFLHYRLWSGTPGYETLQAASSPALSQADMYLDLQGVRHRVAKCGSWRECGVASSEGGASGRAVCALADFQAQFCR